MLKNATNWLKKSRRRVFKNSEIDFFAYSLIIRAVGQVQVAKTGLASVCVGSSPTWSTCQVEKVSLLMVDILVSICYYMRAKPVLVIHTDLKPRLYAGAQSFKWQTLQGINSKS